MPFPEYGSGFLRASNAWGLKQAMASTAELVAKSAPEQKNNVVKVPATIGALRFINTKTRQRLYKANGEEVISG